MIYNTTGMAGVNAIELNYNWVVDFLTICPSTEKKMDLLTGPSSVTVYDATGHAVMEGTEEKKEKSMVVRQRNSKCLQADIWN